jgi:hypothetical protein
MYLGIAAPSVRTARLLLMSACSIAALAAPSIAVAQAQDTPTAANQGQPAPPENGPPAPAPSDDQIVVIGNRAIIASLKDVGPEQVIDEDAVDSYAVSTLSELLDEVRSENGDDEASYLLNGVPVKDLGDVADLPVEAVARIETLPRGAAQRIGGGAGQRAYNIVLRPSLESATLTASRESATEGGWSNNRGEALFTSIKGQDRINVTLRGAQSGTLFEAERDFIPRTESIPYSALGNIVPFSGSTIDPALDALAGRPVSIVALTAGGTNPTLASLVAGAGQTNPSNTASFRSLRGAVRPLDFAIAGNKQLNDWLALSFSGRMGLVRTRNLSGLPSARFRIPPSNPFSPFVGSVYLALNDPARPLVNSSDSTTGSLAATLNATSGQWHASLDARYDLRRRTSASSATGSLGANATVADSINPFDGMLAGSIPVIDRLSRSNFTSPQISLQGEGPVFDLWAGPVFARFEFGAAWVRLDSSDSDSQRRFRRHEYGAKAGITFPLTGGEAKLLPALGESELALDIGTIDLGRFGTLDSRSIALNWQPAKWLRIVASEVRDDHAIVPELEAAPRVVTPNVPYFDPLTGETVDVTTVYGGTAGLLPEHLRTRTASVTLTPWPKYNLRLNADYVASDLDNQIGALPPPSSAVAAAFPDRFRRDANGTLILVDSSPVNFARQHTEQLRLGTSFMIRLRPGSVTPAARGVARHRTPPLRLQVNAAQTIQLQGTSVIRAGLPVVDLLDGGAIGIGGGRERNGTDFSVALTRGGTGVRLNARRRGVSYLVIGTAAAPDLLTFDPITTVDLKLFSDLGELFKSTGILKKTRATIAFDNILNDRQRVTNSQGEIPQAYQPVRRDALGRTILFELRKVF